MTVHLISVGDSLLDHLEEPWLYFTDRARADKIVGGEPWLLLRKADAHRSSADASAWLTAALAPPADPAHSSQAAKLLTERAATVSPELWPAHLSAELNTFAQVPGVQHPLSRQDIAILICSDTSKGLLAGLWNAAALTGGDLDRVRYSPAPDKVPADLRGNAWFVRVPGLETGREAGFREVMRGLGLLGRNLLDSGEVPPDEPIRFYLSGGFKASIPYLIGLAEGLRSLSPKRDLEAYVLHELTKTSAIRLPLRRLVANVVRSDLDSFKDDGIRDSKPQPGLLEGYAYEYGNDVRKWRLTAFGEGLRALFGRGPEVL